MSGNSIDRVDPMECRRPADDDVAGEYVAGRLSPRAAEEFEQHMFECDACADEVARAIETRAAFRPPTRRVAGGGWRVGVAIAATLGAVALGLWQLQIHEASLAPPPLRSASAREIRAAGQMSGGTFTASWNAVRGARSYRVQIFNSIGEPLARSETSGTTFRASIGAAKAGEPRYWKVQALDDDRVVVASSPLIKIDTQ
ncbi:MAG TPA: zf-HC2 domain-containing protein [Thermoanaerobaculia bacterium]|nr:zf-HC2 domain-containing protein [Thermoanaerobaculia bacterium]